MVKFINSPLKITGSLILLTGLLIAAFTLGQFLFLGISVFLLGVLIHVTAEMVFKSMNTNARKWWEIALVFFILFLCGLLALDYFGVIKIAP